MPRAEVAPVEPLRRQTGLTRRTILARLKEDKEALDIARCDLLEATRLDHALTPAGEWILDNSYLVRTQILEVQRHLPRDYTSWPAPARDSVSGLAQKLVAATDQAVNENNIRDALREYQATTPLSIAELWSLPLFLRIALIEALTRRRHPRQQYAAVARSRLPLWCQPAGQCGQARQRGF